MTYVSGYKKQELYGSHKRIKRRFPRNKFVTYKPNYCWDADVAFMKVYEKYNNGYRYFLLVIDTFSKYAFTVALRKNNAEEIKSAFKSIFRGFKRKPMKLRSDMGREFNNHTVKSFLTEQTVEYFTTQNTEIKAHFAERCIKTIKSKLEKYMHNKRTYKWIDALQDITKSYNATIHNSIKMAPKDVTENNTIEIWNRLYNSNELRKPLRHFKYNIDDVVRISSIKRTFEREYDIRWSIELFIVAHREVKESIPKYRIKDFKNIMISGTFYEEELQKTSINDDTLYKIETVLKRRVRKGKEEVLVKWQGYNSDSNSWIERDSIVDYR